MRLAKRAARLARPSWYVLRWLDRAVLVRSRDLVVLSLSGVVEDGFRRAYPDLDPRFVRIPNGVSVETFHDRDRQEQSAAMRERFGIPPSRPVALFLAHQFRAKGLDGAIRALGRAPDWHLVVGGRGRPDAFRRTVARCGVADRVHFAGVLPDARAGYCAADAYVLPTWYDSCSLGVVEALACGTPVVTTRRNGAAELVEPGVEGFVVDRPDNVDGIATALQRIASDVEGFRDAARRAAPRLSWEEHVDRVCAVLDDVVEGTGRQL